MKIYDIVFLVDGTPMQKKVIADNIEEAKQIIKNNYIFQWVYIEFIDIFEKEIKKGII